ncbi:MAG: MGMT family protein [Candidatus Atabeyarchaeum deiterrae]
MSVSLEGLKDFQKKVLTLLTKIPKGKVTTYGEIAKALGDSHLSRAVGNAVRNNPYAPTVPCHRVIRSNGEIGGFGGELSGEKINEKIRLLKEEGVRTDDSGRIDLQKYLVTGEDLAKGLRNK